MPGPGAPMLSTALTLGLLLGGCGGNPIGERLAAGFDPPDPAATAPAPAPTPAAPGTDTPPTAATPPDPAPGNPVPPGQPTPPTPPTSPAQPVAGALPYRITLQLSDVDPAAPAEAVTEALRRAGIRFEVETIERLPQAGSPGGAAPGPATAPAPAPAAGQAPAGAAAPAPR